MTSPLSRTIAFEFASLLENSLNRMIGSDKELQSKLALIAGKIVHVEVVDTFFGLEIEIQKECVHVMLDLDRNCDLLIKGRLADFLCLFRSAMNNPAQIEGVELVGDVDLAQKLYQVIKAAEIDWEEEFALRFGDVPARWLGNTARWGRSNIMGENTQVASFIRNLLVEKYHLVPNHERVDLFVDEVDALNADVARLNQRVDRLSRLQRQ